MICNLPHRKVQDRAPRRHREPRPTTHDLILRSQHRFSDPDASVLKCTICLCQHSVAAPHFRAFLAKACTPVLVSSTHHFRVLGKISINGHETHPTHTLANRGGTKCGFYANKRLVKLKDMCVGARARSAHGDLTLGAILGPKRALARVCAHFWEKTQSCSSRVFFKTCANTT